MNIYAITSLIGFTSCLVLGAFVYFNNMHNSVNRSFGFLSIIIFMWVFGCFMESTVTTRESALFWDHLLYTAVAIAPVLFVRFSFVLTGIRKNKVLLTLYVLSGIFLVFNFVPGLREFFVQDVQRKFSFRYIAVPGPVYLYFYLPYFTFCIFYNLYILLEAIRKEVSSRKREQFKYMIISFTAILTAALMYVSLLFSVEAPPVDNLLVGVFSLITAYAIVRHHFLDIEVIIKKSFVFAGMSVFAFGVFVLTTLLVSQLFSEGNMVSLAISALIISLGMRPLENFLVDSTNKFLFQKKYEYKQILKAFIDQVITVLSLDEIANSTLELLDETIQPYTSSIFILNKAENKYQLYSSLGLEDKDFIFASDSKLITFFKTSHQPAIAKEIHGVLSVNSDIQQEMSSIKAVICLPLMLHDDLIGFISLGNKKSDADYTKDDLDVLSDLVRTESIAIGNAQLLQEAAQAERRAAIGTMSAGINHEIGNPVNIMSTRIQLFKLSRQKGLFQNQSNEEILNQAEATLDECLRQATRISEITRKLANFAKPGREFKPELVNVPQEINESLDMASHDIELEKIRITKEVSGDRNDILADKHEIQQIFFNIIRNAGQAIEGQGTINLKVFTNTNGKVHIEVEDTGKGIPEDKLNRIFQPFFTTKSPNKGTGLGLSIVRQLTWKNKGEISFRSQVGVGTTFILEFPRAPER